MNSDSNATAALLDDDEDECRVCRGPAEEGRPLYKPCKCSGSIGLTHQDCLQSWLQVQRGNGTCELCKTQFRFSPQYSEHAPDRLPVLQVCVGLCRRVVARWLPFTLRIMFAASLWLIVAPIVTAYLYHGWMNRPSAVLERFSWKLLTTDLVSGAVVAAYIIISFLSLMSFADFLRVEWQQRGLGPLMRNQQQQLQHRLQIRNEQNDNHDDEQQRENPGPDEEDIDNGVWDRVQQEILARVQQEILAQPRTLRRRRHQGLGLKATYPDHDLWETEGILDGIDDTKFPPLNDDDEDDDDDSFVPDFDPDEDMDVDNDEEEADSSFDEEEDLQPRLQPLPPLPQIQDNDRREAQRAQQENGRVDRPFDFDQDENVEVDINIALDELLGVRGPLGAVARNLVWLLAFNAVYVGFFCFVPRTVGAAVGTIFFNTTNPSRGTNVTQAYEELSSHTSVRTIMGAISAESESEQALFRFHDLVMVTLGYLACATAAWIGRLLWHLSQRIGFLAAAGRRTGNVEAEEVREMVDEMNRLVNGHMDAQRVDDPPGVALSMAVGVALEAMMAIVKVGVLLFLKMFFLPISLGVCLDASVASVFRFKLEDRIAYAGRDLFSFVLLHWVCGITFMLLVTVSVLQLREVAHPDLLAQIIRPQEPQPDLLGNLLHESASTHAKRMALSLVIYAVLWAMYVYTPARIVVATGLVDKLQSFDLKLFYVITPKLQVPFELLFFHLCMLGLLERYKNGLGEMQHHWLKHLTGFMGLQECILPQNVDAFEYVGTRPVFLSGRTVDPFWFDLAKIGNHPEELLDDGHQEFEASLVKNPTPPLAEEGFTREDGERVVKEGADYIRLPILLPGRALKCRSTLLRTKIGKHRLALGPNDQDEYMIHLWREVPGSPIPRPPEGWDDLGVEPPDVQGRWAYGNEKKSAIEGGVAWRRPLFPKKQKWGAFAVVVLKLLVLLVLSWIATTFLLCAVIAVPPIVGRLLYAILRVPDKWVHDPMAFALGFVISFPAVAVGARAVVSTDVPLLRRVAIWLSRFHFPSAFKSVVLLNTAVLWFGVAPLLLGTAYDVAFVKSQEWFGGKVPLVDRWSLIMDWSTGTLLLYVWSFLCVRGVLTRRFRAFLLEGREIPEEENNGDARAAAWQNAGDGRLKLSWQGKHGRMAKFWEAWNSAILDWDWDKVDPTVLLHDVAVPVTVDLFWMIFLPGTSLAVGRVWYPHAPGVVQAAIVRACLAIACIVQVARVWQDQLKNWFEVAHKSARDDLYLVGEVLLNYGE